MNGKGKMHWTNGNRYDGYWEDGFPKENETYKWRDGSFYVGNWRWDPSSSTLVDGNLDWDPQEVSKVDLANCMICPGEKVPVLPSQKKLAVWRSTKGADPNVRPIRLSVDGRTEAGMDKEFGPFDRSLRGSLEDFSTRESPIRNDVWTRFPPNGPLPSVPVFQSMDASSFRGNKGLYGGPLGDCNTKSSFDPVPPSQDGVPFQGKSSLWLLLP